MEWFGLPSQVDPEKPVLVAGDPERIHEQKVREEGGIYYHDNLIAAMVSSAWSEVASGTQGHPNSPTELSNRCMADHTNLYNVEKGGRMSTETAIHLSQFHLLHFKIWGIPAVLLPQWFVLNTRSTWHPKYHAERDRGMASNLLLSSLPPNINDST